MPSAYTKTLDYLLGQLPMFQRVGAAAYRSDLTNITALCKILGNPQNGLKCIHVAGTNGKGSVAHMIASVLQEHGYKVGLFVSPHYKDYRERIKINGKLITKTFVSGFVLRNKKKFQHVNASFFEITTAMAFEYFKQERVEFAVIETGMGGRLDSTNIISPVLSVITNISYDHQQFLGKTIPKIAAEKAGIIKPGVPVVIGETQNGARMVFKRKAEATGSKIWFADKSILWHRYTTDLKGSYQRKNLTTALMAIDVLCEIGIEISFNAIENGLMKVAKNTSFIGRWMVVNEKPLTIFDSAHNEAGIKELTSELKKQKADKIHFVYGTVADKDISPVLALLPENTRYYFCKADIPRGLDASELKQQALKFKLKGEAFPSVKKAFSAAKKNAGKNDLILVAGSVFVVAEVI